MHEGVLHACMLLGKEINQVSSPVVDLNSNKNGDWCGKTNHGYNRSNSVLRVFKCFLIGFKTSPLNKTLVRNC